MEKEKKVKQQEKGFDLVDFCMTDTSKLDIIHPGTGEPVGMWIELHSMYSNHMRKSENKIKSDKDQFWRDRKRRGPLNEREQAIYDEMIDEAGLNLLIGATIAWGSDGNGNQIRMKGELLDCTPENVRKLYTDTKTQWIRKQVDLYLGNDANFFPG